MRNTIESTLERSLGSSFEENFSIRSLPRANVQQNMLIFGRLFVLHTFFHGFNFGGREDCDN
jgi:hypothetical protein